MNKLTLALLASVFIGEYIMITNLNYLCILVWIAMIHKT